MDSQHNLSVRLASPGDLPIVQACAEAAYSPYIERMNQVPAPMKADFKKQISEGLVYIAEVTDAFVGYVVFYKRDDHMHLENIAVLPSFTGHGIGKQLIMFVEATAKTAGLKTVELYTNEAMTENLILYPKLGYKETHRQQQQGFNRVFFCKTV